MGDDKPFDIQGGIDWGDVQQHMTEEDDPREIRDIAVEQLRQIWARRAAVLAKPPLREEEGEQYQLVLVQLGQEVYGLEAQYISTIRPAAQITRVPRVPEWVAGVVNLRGRIVSVIDLRRFFGLADGEGDGKGETRGIAYLVMAEIPKMEVALLVDDVLSVEALPMNRIQAASNTVRELRAEYVRGVAERRWKQAGENGGDHVPMMVVLDLVALLEDDRLVLFEEIV